MRVALYARVSSELQDVENSISGQLRGLKRYADENGHTVVAEFTDEAISGKREDRAGFQDLMTAATSKPRPFDIVLVWDYFRFSRGDTDDSAIYRSRLKKAGVKLIAITQPLVDGPGGRILEGVYGGLAAYQSEKIGVDTKRGMIEALSKGFHVGRVPIGYQATYIMDGQIRRTKLEVCPDTGPLVKRIFSLFLSGNTTRRIAETLNSEGQRTGRGRLWTKSSVSWILKNPVYIGCITWNRDAAAGEQVHIEDNHHPLISKENFAKIQELLAQNSPVNTHPRTVSSRHLLSGITHCGCGHKLYGKVSDTQTYYACAGRAAGVGCKTLYLKAAHLEEFVLDKIAEVILQPEHVIELVNLVNADLEAGPGQLIESVKNELDEAKKGLANIFKAIEKGTIDTTDMSGRIKELKARVAELEPEYYSRSARLGSRDRISEQAAEIYVAQLSAMLFQAEPSERKSLMRSFIKAIKINLPDVTIEYTLPLPNGKPGGESNALAFWYKPPTQKGQERLGEFRPPTPSPGNRETNRRCPD